MVAGGDLRFGERQLERVADPHHLAGRFHLRPQHDVHPGELAEREHALFDADVSRHDLFGDAQVRQLFPGHHLGRDPRDRHAGRLGDERHRPAGPRVDLQHVQRRSVVGLGDRELDVHQSDDVQPLGQPVGRVADLVHRRFRQRERRQRTSTVTGVHAGLLDVLHDAHDHRPLAVADRVDVDLGRLFQKSVDQHRLAVGDDECLRDEPLELRFVVTDLHRPSAQHERRPDQHRVPDPLDLAAGLGHVPRDTGRRLPQTQFVDHRAELFPVLGQLDRVDRRADDVHPGVVQTAGEVQRRLPAELDDHPLRRDGVVDVQHVLDRQRLEEQRVGGVVIGRHGFRVAVDHDRFGPHLAQRERGVATAIIELDALADSVRPAAQDHHPAFVVRRRQLGLVLVRAVVIRRVSLELRRTGVDRFINRRHADRFSMLPHGQFVDAKDRRDLAVAEPVTLDLPHCVGVDRHQIPDRFDLILAFDQLEKVVQKPGVDVGQLMQLVRRHPVLHRVPQIEHAFGVGRGQLRPNLVLGRPFVGPPPVLRSGPESELADLQPTERLLEGLPKSPTDRHRLADALHLRHQRRVGFRKLFEREPRDLRHDVIDRRLETRLGLLRDVVGQLV